MSFMYTHSSDSSDLRKNEISHQDAVRMFQNWARFEATYISVLPYYYYVEEPPGIFFPAEF